MDGAGLSCPRVLSFIFLSFSLSTCLRDQKLGAPEEMLSAFAELENTLPPLDKENSAPEGDGIGDGEELSQLVEALPDASEVFLTFPESQPPTKSLHIPLENRVNVTVTRPKKLNSGTKININKTFPAHHWPIACPVKAGVETQPRPMAPVVLLTSSDEESYPSPLHPYAVVPQDWVTRIEQQKREQGIQMAIQVQERVVYFAISTLANLKRTLADMQQGSS